jgi:YesN/AraC family two-component response regulator
MRKVEHAKRELERTDLPITEIGCNLGWSSGNYFCTVFKKLTGMSPLQYRKEFSDNLD